MKVVWTDRATLERERQLTYIGERSTRAADRLRGEIVRQFELLTDHPFLGRPGRVRGTRELVISRTPYLASYRVNADEIVVLRFFHTAQRRPGWRPR